MAEAEQPAEGRLRPLADHGAALIEEIWRNAPDGTRKVTVGELSYLDVALSLSADCGPHVMMTRSMTLHTPIGSVHLVSSREHRTGVVAYEP
jgi:hypothetical protein